MSLEGAVQTEPIREKLRNLMEHMPSQDDVFYQFGIFLADRLRNPDIIPAGFNLVVRTALYDLKRGTDSYTREPIRNSLADQGGLFYVALALKIPDIVRAVCPEDFAQKFEEIYDKTRSGK